MKNAVIFCFVMLILSTVGLLQVHAQTSGVGAEFTFTSEHPDGYDEPFPNRLGFRVVVIQEIIKSSRLRFLGSAGYASQKKIHSVSSGISPNGILISNIEADGWNLNFDARLRIDLSKNSHFKPFLDAGFSGGRLITSRYSKNSFNPVFGAGINIRDKVQVSGGYKFPNLSSFGNTLTGNNRNRAIYFNFQTFLPIRKDSRWAYSLNLEYRKARFEQPVNVSSNPGSYSANVIQLNFGIFYKRER